MRKQSRSLLFLSTFGLVGALAVAGAQGQTAQPTNWSDPATWHKNFERPSTSVTVARNAHAQSAEQALARVAGGLLSLPRRSYGVRGRAEGTFAVPTLPQRARLK